MKLSGSSIFKMSGKYPVVEGVFSYMLWGTCRGRKEPTYYNKVKITFFWFEIKKYFRFQITSTGLHDVFQRRSFASNENIRKLYHLLYRPQKLKIQLFNLLFIHIGQCTLKGVADADTLTASVTKQFAH